MREKHFSSLLATLGNAESQLALWEQLRKAQADDLLLRKMNRHPSFFLQIESALFGSVITLLYSVLETRNDTTNLKQLVNSCAECDSTLDVTHWEDQLKKLKPIWKKICILRNSVIGHKSTKTSSKEAFTKASISPSDMRSFLSESKEFVRSLSVKAREKDMEFGFGVDYDYQLDQIIEKIS